MDRISSSFLVILFLGVNNSSSDILQRQKRNWIVDTFKIEEEYSGTFPYDLGSIQLDNKFTVMKLHGQGVDIDPVGILSIDEVTGVVRVHGKLDYEKFTRLSLNFEAFDTVKNAVDTKLSVEVQVLDINDNAPTFTTSHYQINLKESAPQGSYVIVVIAKDLDSPSTKNGTFDLTIGSITPQPLDLEFYIEQNGNYGNISFRGCLDYERAKRYTILVVATDRGEKVQLSSTCTVIVNIQDENDHLPLFTGPTPTATVEEREVDVAILTLQATDKDTKGTDAWMAKYVIHGEKSNHFRIDTNPETNEGVMYVTKSLDYADQSSLNLTVTVENVGAHFSCKVVSKTVRGSGLWDVATTTGKDLPLSTRVVTVNVEDVNDPPIFKPKNHTVRVYEDVAVGTHLWTPLVIDRDVAHGNKFEFFKGEDPGEWVSLDTKTGAMKSAKTLDRESPLVKDNIYSVTVLAVDNGKPPQTGTGTLFISLHDRNDNAPQLVKSDFIVCTSDEVEKANITAYDLDGAPFSAPFRFKLLGDVEKKWRIDPLNGESVNLIRKDMAFVGHHDLQLQVFDQQEHSTLHNISVMVCECEGGDNCRGRSISRTDFLGAFPIMFIAFLLLLGVFLMALLLTCKKEVKMMPDDWTEQNLIPSNTEHPGSDCKMTLKTLQYESKNMKETYLLGASQQPADMENGVFTQSNNYQNYFQGTQGITSRELNGFTRQDNANSSIRRTHSGLTRRTLLDESTHYGFTGTNRELYEDYTFLEQFLDMKINHIQTPAEELGDYAPHLYAEEGHPDSSLQLEAIDIQEIPFHPDMFLYLDPRFNTLASICSSEVTSS